MTYVLKISDELVGPWLTDMAAAAPYLGLMTVDPYSVSDPLTAEVAGYTRAIVSWDIDARTMAPVDDALFAGVASGVTVMAVAGFDAIYNGTMGWAVPFTPFTTTGYGSLTLTATDLRVGFGTP